MKRYPIILAAWIAVHLVALSAPELRRIERTILKEPTYQTQEPKYCLAAFGSEAQTRVWLVLDGDTLYVDRNGNLDLTDPGEQVKAKLRPKTKDELEFNAGVLTLTNGVPPNARLEVLAIPGLTFVYCHSDGKPWQRAVVDNAGYLAFGSKAEIAPVLHFNGPLTIGLRFNHRFKRNAPAEDLDLMVGTPGMGIGSFVRFGHEGVIPKIYPELDIAFPSSEGAPIRVKTTLEKRC